MMRALFLMASQNAWLRHRVPRYRFVRSSVARFMPGEEISDALAAARGLADRGINAVFTHLGENVADAREADAVAEHYLHALDLIRSQGLHAELSVKLTQLGLDINKQLCYANLKKIIERTDSGRSTWIDMEATPYTDATLELYRRARRAYPNVGVCLQAYLYRTADDLRSLLPLGPAIRLVKGAYMEPPDRAFPRKRDVDENFFALTRLLLSQESRAAGVRTAIATHDKKLIRRIEQHAAGAGLARDSFEFQMLFGIQRDEQLRLAKEGWRSAVLIAYGSYWFSWYMRRLAERPANLLFVARNLFGG